MSAPYRKGAYMPTHHFDAVVELGPGRIPGSAAGAATAPTRRKGEAKDAVISQIHLTCIQGKSDSPEQHCLHDTRPHRSEKATEMTPA
jgi:hypothetical protein